MGNHHPGKMALLFLLVFGLLVAYAGVSTAATLTVGPGQAYTTIQSAINAASAGDTINVKTGFYNEDLVISKNNLALKSIDGPGLAEIQGAALADVVSIGSGLGVTIDGFRILPGGSANTGIYFEGGATTDPVTIINNVIEDFNDSMAWCFYAMWGYLENTDFRFSKNTLRNSTRGIYVWGFKNSTIEVSSNILEDCDEYPVMVEYLDYEGDGTDARINDNRVTLSAGKEGDTAISMTHLENTTEISGNYIEGDFQTGMYLEYIGADGQAPAIVNIEKNEIRGTGIGLHFRDMAYALSTEVTVRYNTIENNEYGIYVHDLTYWPNTIVKFRDNNIVGNSLYGFYNLMDGSWLDAQENWWGEDTGPYHPTTNPGGSGNEVSNYVDYGNWRTTAWEEEDDDSGSGCSAGILDPLFLLLFAPMGLLLRKNR
jgi:nitrous oxidase accessory protein NosD